VRRRHHFARAVGRRLGYHVVRADHYSPIPDLEALPDALWDEAAPMPGVELRIEAAAALLERELAPFIAEYAPPAEPPGTAHGYHTHNPMYPAFDAEVLYAMVRHLKPARVVEVGAGFSTRVVRDALARHPAEHLVYDPDPAAAERAGDAEVRPLRAQEIPLAEFSRLEAGDVLFIDTTHTVKAGGDVVRLVLEVLPSLAPGVVVHVHDFYRPFEYPRLLMERFRVVWQEHYLLQAFLAFNEAFEVLIANHALARLRPELVRAVVPGVGDGIAPGSALWLRRVA
jgi:predicted O-methyltransferase YrrM